MTAAAPKYYRSARNEAPVCLRRDSDTIATVVHIPLPNQRLPLAYYVISDRSKEELDAICLAMVETTAGKFEDFMVAFFSQAKSNGQLLHDSRQKRYESGQLKL